MILVSGAAGKTGQAITKALTAAGYPVRAFVARQEQVATVRSAGAREVVIGNFLDDESIENACTGADKIYHICPNMHPDEVLIAECMLLAARRAGVTQFVYHSVLHPQVEAMPHHWQKMHVEEKIFTSGIDFTILQPAAYMQNLKGYWKQIVEQKVYALPYSGGTKMSMVDLDDVAEAAVRVLTREGHIGAVYELVGAASISPQDTVRILARCLGTPVTFERIPIQEWEERATGMNPYQKETLKKMFAYYESYGFYGNPSVLTWLLGRAPRSLEELILNWMA